MKRLLLLSLLFVSIWFSLNGSNPDTVSIVLQDSLKEYDQRIKKVETEVKEIRRDQLNYSIEKDLLKETFSTNYNTINLVLSIVLITLTIVGGIFGYIGFKNIAELRKDYLTELNDLKSLRNKFSERFSALVKREKEFNVKLEKINATNEKQSSQIRLLELRDKVSSLIRQRNYARAFEYINASLMEFSNDLELSFYKTICLLKQDKYKEYIQAIQELLVIAEKQDPSYIKVLNQNLAEAALFIQNIPLFDKTYAKAEYFDNKTLNVYLMALKYFVLKDSLGLRNYITSYIEPIDKAEIVIDWNFEDVIKFLTRFESPDKELFKTFIRFLLGKTPKGQLQTELSKE